MTVRFRFLACLSLLAVLTGPGKASDDSFTAAMRRSAFEDDGPCEPRRSRGSQASCEPHGWYNVGPGRPGVWANVAVDARGSGTIYYASIGGGVRKSTDHGATWSTVNTGLSSAAAYAFAMDSKDANTAYVGVFAGGPAAPPGRESGVFKTDDGGATWSLMPATKIDIPLSLGADRNISGRVFMGGLGGAILRTLDGGATWTRVRSGTSPVTAVVVDPFNSDVVYASTLAGLLKSTDVGTTWTAVASLPGAEVWGLAIDPANENVMWVATNNSGILRSTDGGATWRTTGALPATPFSLAIDDSAAHAVFAATTSGVWKSSDDGATWVQTALSDRRAISITMDSRHVLWAGTTSGPLTSPNTGATWSDPDPTAGGAHAFAYAVTVDPSSGRKVFASTLGSTALISESGGVKWTPAGTSYAARESRRITVDPTDSNRLYSGALYSGLFKSVDGGATWSRRTLGSGYSYVWVAVVDPLSPNIVWAGTSGEGLFKSVDYGDTFTAIRNMPRQVQGVTVDPRNDNIVFAASSDGVLRSQDGGLTWTNVLSRPAWTITIARDDSQLVFASTKAFGVFRSMDGGTTWTAINDGITNLQMGRAAGPLLDPVDPQVVYVASEGCGCVYKSVDGGDHWFSVSDGLEAMTSVFGLDLDPRRPGVLFAATPGGIFKTTTGGE